MGTDRRAAAAKTYEERKKKEEQEKARAAVLAAAKRDVENAKSAVGANEKPNYRTGMKNANAGITSDKTVKSPVKESAKKTSYRTGMKSANAGTASDRTVKSPVALPLYYRDSFQKAVSLPTAQKNNTNNAQSIKKTMQGRSEDYARLESRKAGANEATRKQIEAAQKRLHEQNVQDARKIGAAFHRSGTWMQEGKPLYQANVLPGQTQAEQIEGAKKSLADRILSPSQQEAIAEYEERIRNPDLLERIRKTITGAGKQYAGSMENAYGLGMTGRNMGREQEDAREIEVWQDEIQTWKQSLAEWEADGSLTEEEREDLNLLIEANQKKIDAYNRAHNAQQEAAAELYRSADALTQSGAEDIEHAKKGLGSAGQTLVDVGAGSAQLVGDIALGGTAPMFLRSVGGSAQQARQEGATHSEQVSYGMLSGAAGILSEKISNVAGPLKKAFGKGMTDDLLQSAIDRAASKLADSASGEKILGAIAKHGVNALGEGFEESFEAAIDPLLKRMTYDPDAQLDLADVIHDGIIGAGVGLVAGTGGEVIQNTANGALNLPGKITEKTQGTRATLPTGVAETENGLSKSLPLTEPKAQTQLLPDLNAQFGQNGGTTVNTENSKSLNDRIRENSALIEKGGVVSELTGQEFASGEKKLLDQITDFFKSIGNKVVRNGFGEVTLTRSGARDSLSHGVGREKAIAFAAVPDVIQNGQIIDEQHNWKGRRYDTVTFGGHIKIAGQDYDMGVIVKRYDNPEMASKYYVHEVLLRNKEGEATTFKTGTISGYPSDVTSPSGISIPQNPENSKALPISFSETRAKTTLLPNVNAREMGAQATGMPNVNARETQTAGTAGQAGGYDGFVQSLTALRDKLEEDLRIAHQTLPEPGTEGRIRTLESSLADVNNQIAAMERNRPELVQAQQIAEALGAEFQLADLGAANGRYENGAITINPYTENPVRQVFVHELTHYLESSGTYDELSGRVLRFIARDMQTDIRSMRDAIIRDYAAYGVTLDTEGAQRELVAKFCEEKLFADEKSIQRLAQTDRTLFQRIRQWITDTIAKLRGTKQENALREMERLYEKAAQSVGEQAGYDGAQYEIKTDANGETFVDVTEDVLKDRTEKDIPKTLSDIIQNKFHNLIIANGQEIGVNAKTGSEWRRSKEAQALWSRDRMTYDDKIRSFSAADEILAASRNYIGEAAKHQNYAEFARGNVNFRVGENGYTADVIVGITKNGRAYLYDLVNIKHKAIADALYTSSGKSPADRSNASAITDSIPQTGQNGNPSGQNSMGLSFGELRDNVRGALGNRPQGRWPQGHRPGTELTDIERTLMGAWNARGQAEQLAANVRNDLELSRNDIRFAEAAAANGVDAINWGQADHPEAARLYGEALADAREAGRPLREFQARRQQEMQDTASEAAGWIATMARDKRFGLAYQRETMERNIRDIFGAENREYADEIIKEYITPVHRAVAEGNRLKNHYRDQVRAMELTEHESALLQMRLEGETGAEAEYIANNHIRVTPEMDAKLNRAAETFRTIYNELYTQINAAMLRNGQEPMPFRRDYAPHFRRDRPDTMLGKIRFILGLGKDSSLSLPTDIAGITDEFRPGKKWFGNMLQREGELTDFDAVGGFDRYIETAADVITLTDSIQRLRALEDETRYALSDESIRDQIDAIRANDALNPLERRQQMEELYGDNPTTTQQLIADLRNQRRMGMGGFVTELRRYTDNLAGKKAREDRSWEQALGRQVYTITKNMEGRTAANMLALNPGAWLTNLIPITQASGEVSHVNLLAGMRDTVGAFIRDDGFADASDFLTNRTGSDQLDKTTTRKISDATNAGMDFVDRFASQTIVRGRYRQNMQNGMSPAAAIADADAFAAGLMADRSKGAQPTIFNATNPVTKTLTMFQVEVNNQLSYLFKDLPQAQAQRGAAALAVAFTNVFVGAHMYNVLYHALTGRDAALDPIGWILDALGIDDVAWIKNKLGIGNGDDGDEEKEERTGFDIAESLADSVAENLPFVGGLLGGGRVPIQSALPSIGTMWDSWKSDAVPEKKAQTIGKEFLKPVTYLLPPFGGGAVRRAIEGYQAVAQGGVYGMDNDGNKTLNFPIYSQNAQDYAKAMLFGKYSLPTGQKYVDSGFEGKLNTEETEAFDTLRGTDGTLTETVYNAIRGLGTIEAEKDADGNTIASRKELQRRALFENSGLTTKQKETLDRMLLATGEDDTPANYSSADAFRITAELESGQQERAFRALEAGISADTYISTRESFPANAKKADKIQAIFERNDLDAGQKAVLEEIMLRSDGQESYTPADYTSEQTLTLSTHMRPGTDTHLSQTHREKAAAGAQAGVSTEMYLYAWDEIGNMESSIVDGRSVGDVSYKKKVFIDALTQDSTQRQYLYDAFGVSKTAQSGKAFILYGAGENPVETYRKNLVITFGT